MDRSVADGKLDLGSWKQALIILRIRVLEKSREKREGNLGKKRTVDETKLR